MAGTIINDKVCSGSLHYVEKLIPHEDYRIFENDIALVKIQHEFLLGDSIKIIELNRDDIPSGADLIISGWGRIETGGELPKILKWNILFKVHDSVCADIAGIERGIICLGHPVGQGACNGDSGGPALFNGKVAGVANFVINGCASDYPDGYAKVSHFVEWIEKNIQENEKVAPKGKITFM